MHFVCSLWRGKGFDKLVARYDERDVFYLAEALTEYGHSLTVISDGSFYLASIPDIEEILMPPEVRELPDYLPKLWMWSEELHTLIGEPFAHIDLDCLILDDPAEVFWPGEKLQFWDWARREPYNTSLVYITPGCGNQIWERREYVEKAKLKWPRWTGDQSFVGWMLGPHCCTFGEARGVRQFRHCTMQDGPLPGTRVLFFCGAGSPHTVRNEVPWIDAHLRGLEGA